MKAIIKNSKRDVARLSVIYEVNHFYEKWLQKFVFPINYKWSIMVILLLLPIEVIIEFK